MINSALVCIIMLSSYARSQSYNCPAEHMIILTHLPHPLIVILAMSFNWILSSNLCFVLSKYPVFIMTMPLNMILVMYVKPCILSYDYLTS